MKRRQLDTTRYRREPCFIFNGKIYFVNSYVKLTEYGKEYLDTSFDSVQLIEHFHYKCNEKEAECHKFVTNFIGVPPYPFTISTDEPLEELIKEVVVPVKYEPSNKQPDPLKIKNKDWKVPDVLCGWIIFAAFFFGVEILKDWSLKLILRLFGSWIFSNWRNRRMIEEGMVKFDKKQEGER